MSNLPDEIWRRIMEIGIETSRLGFKDLCCLSISCRRLRRLSDAAALWSSILALDFPTKGDGTSSSSSSSSSHPLLPSKSLYKTKFERDKARKLAAWRLSVLKEESQIAVHAKNLENFRAILAKEHEKLKGAFSELTNLEKVRRATVAVNVWQPGVVLSSQRQLVEQCTVPIESRISALKMELRVCKQQIAVFNKACIDLQKKLDDRKEALASLKYHPIHPIHKYQLGTWHNFCNPEKKKLKRWSDSNGKVQHAK